MTFQEGKKIFSKLKNLESIEINTLDENVIKALCINCPRLKSILLKYSHPSDQRNWRSLSAKSLEFIADSLPQLETFSCNSLSEISDEELIYFANRCGNIRELNLGNAAITANGIAKAAQCFPKLQSFSTNRGHFNDQAIKIMVECCPNMKNFVSKYPSKFSDECFELMGNNWKKLEFIELHNFSQNGIPTLINNCEGLKRLHLFNADLKDDLFDFTKPNHLEHLILHKIFNLSDEGIARLINNSPHLQAISIRDCPDITLDCLMHLDRFPLSKRFQLQPMPS